MKFSTAYLCNVNVRPDDLTSSHNNFDHIYLDERKCRGDGETPIISGPQDSDPDKSKSSSDSDSSNSGRKKHYYA